MPTLNKEINNQLTRKLIYYMLFVALSVALFAGLYIAYYRHTCVSLGNKIEESAQKSASDVSIALSLYLETNYTQLRMVADKLPQDLPQSISGTSLMQDNADIEGINIIFDSGDKGYYYIADSGKRVNLINTTRYAQGVFAGKPSLYYASQKMFMSVPVYQNGDIVAAIEGRFSMATVANVLKETSLPDSRLALVSANYEVAYKSSDTVPDDLFDRLSVSMFPKGQTFIALRADFDSGKEAFATRFDDSGKMDSFVAFDKVSADGWYAVAYVDSFADLYSELLTPSSLIFGLIILMFVVFVTMLYVFMSRSIKKEKIELYELSLLTENIPCGVFSCTNDPNFNLLSESEGFLKMLDYTSEEISTICNNSIWQLIYQPDRIVFSQSVASQLQYGNTIETEMRLVKKDGNLIWVRNTGKMVRVNGNETLYCVVLDITEAKSYNEQLASTSDDLKSIMDVIPGGLARISINDNYDIHMANASFYHLCGYTPDDFRADLDGGMQQIIDARDREKLKKNIDLANVDGDPIITEFRIFKKDGKSIWLSMHAQKNIAECGDYELLCVFTDISSLREAYNQAKADREKARTLAAMATDIIFEYDIKNDEVRFTGNRLLDLPQVLQNVHKQVFESRHLPVETASKINNILDTVFQTGKAEMQEVGINNVDGSVLRWYNIYAYSITYAASPIIIGKLVDVTERKHEMEALIEANKRDPLTNLYNTSTTRYYIDKFLDKPGKDDGRLHAFMMLDIDNFKTFNDVLGHATGDSVLIEISKKINSLFRSTDIIGRVGGDEFVLLIKNCASIATIREKAKKICDSFENTFFGNRSSNLKLSVSIGIALVGKDGKTYAELFEKADIALYKVKSSGKNSYQFYSKTN